MKKVLTFFKIFALLIILKFMKVYKVAIYWELKIYLYIYHSKLFYGYKKNKIKIKLKISNNYFKKHRNNNFIKQ